MAERNFLSAEDWIGGAGQDGTDFDRAASIEAAGQMREEVELFEFFLDREDEIDGVQLADGRAMNRADNRRNRRAAGKARQEVQMFKAGKASSVKERFVNTTFAASRNIRLEVADKRLAAERAAFHPSHVADALEDHRSATASASRRVAKRQARLSSDTIVVVEARPARGN